MKFWLHPFDKNGQSAYSLQTYAEIGAQRRLNSAFIRWNFAFLRHKKRRRLFLSIQGDEFCAGKIVLQNRLSRDIALRHTDGAGLAQTDAMPKSCA